MRVVVAADQIAGLSSLRAGTSVARAFAGAGAQCAVVPISDVGRGFVDAWADLRSLASKSLVTAEGVEVDFAWDEERGEIALAVTPRPADAWQGTSSDLGHGVLAALESVPGQVRAVVVDVSSNQTHDGGRGFIDVVETALDQVTLVGVVGLDEVDQQLAGLRGIVSRDGRPDGLDVADLLSYDAALVEWAGRLSARRGDGMDVLEQPGAGACGGMGAAILGLGGRVQAASAFLAERAGLAVTMGQADLVVTCCDQLDFGSMGGGAVRHVVDLAGQAMRPAIVITSKNFISQRELRSVGVEQACELGEPEGHEPETWLQTATRRIAPGWIWS